MLKFQTPNFACYNTTEYGFASSSRTLSYDMYEVSLVVSAILM